MVSSAWTKGERDPSRVTGVLDVGDMVCSLPTLSGAPGPVDTALPPHLGQRLEAAGDLAFAARLPPLRPLTAPPVTWALLGPAARHRKAYVVLTERILSAGEGQEANIPLVSCSNTGDRTEMGCLVARATGLAAGVAELVRKWVLPPAPGLASLPVTLRGSGASQEKWEEQPCFQEPSPAPLLGRHGRPTGWGQRTQPPPRGALGGAGPRHQKRCRGWGPKCMGRLCSRGRWTGAKS